VIVLTVCGSLDAIQERRAELSARSLLQAAEVYAANPANPQGRWPATVADLNTPPFGSISFLRTKEKDLMDPWGMPYRCLTDRDERGVVRWYVWTERVVGGTVRKIGQPPPEKKK
jgi:hypothetical protein